MGSVVELKETGGDRRKVVVMKYYPDKGAVMVIDLKSRRRKTVCLITNVLVFSFCDILYQVDKT